MERVGLYEGLSYESYLTNQIEPALEARQAALEIWRAAGVSVKEGDTLRWLSRLHWFAGRRAEADQYAAEAIAVLEALPPGPELAMAYSNRASLDMMAGTADDAIEWAQKAIRLAEPMGNDEILSHALNNLGAARLHLDDESGWADLERSLKIALAHGFQEHAARAYCNVSNHAVELHRYPLALRYLEEGLAHCDNDLWSLRLSMLAVRARAWLGLGEWDQAIADAEVVLQHPNAPPLCHIPTLTVLAFIRILRGDPDACEPPGARTQTGPTRQ